jgi:putative CocE/NonD family hydrolase
LTEPVELIGPVQLVAHVETSAADTDVTAKLLDVHPNGFVQRLCDGLVRLRYRDGFDRALPVTSGEVYEVEVVMWDTCVRIPAGHRLRVEVDGVMATNRLWHTPQRPGRLLVNCPGGRPQPALP